MARLPLPLPPLPRAAGFVLPLAVLAALVLLLAALSTQTVLHQSRLRNAAALAQRRGEDQLAAAAHHLLDRLLPHHACLLDLPLEEWGRAGPDCGTATALEPLRDGVALAVPYRLIAWQPRAPGSGQPAGVDLELALLGGSGLPPWLGAFSIELGGDPPRVLALRELGLRGLLR